MKNNPPLGMWLQTEWEICSAEEERRPHLPTTHNWVPFPTHKAGLARVPQEPHALASIAKMDRNGQLELCETEKKSFLLVK